MTNKNTDRCCGCGFKDRCPALVRLLGGPPERCWWFRLFHMGK